MSCRICVELSLGHDGQAYEQRPGVQEPTFAPLAGGARTATDRAWSSSADPGFDLQLEPSWLTRNTVPKPTRGRAEQNRETSVRYEKSTWRMETLVTGMVLVSALATQIGVTSIRAAAGSYSARTVVDAVSLAVRSPALPAVAFVASRPGNVLQGAAAVTNVPYRAFTIYAYPYGSAARCPA